jgi:putative heme-binding domain-containing protein
MRVFWCGVIGLFAVTGGVWWAARGADSPGSQPLVLHARLREPAPSGAGFAVKEKTLNWQPAETAIIICDMWNQHWCKGATRRVGELAPVMNRFVSAARNKGVLVIHAPSSCMEAYQNHPGRKRAISAPKAANLPGDIEGWCNKIPSEEKGVYPIDQSDGGCDDGPACPGGSPWKSEIATIQIRDEDAISDSGVEIWNLLESRGIKHVMLMGVHTNMCVLGRPFGLRQLAQHGKEVVLVRDLTDTMYNSRSWPYVSHFEGTNRIIEHIEKYVCPTIVSTDLTGEPAFAFQPEDRPRAVFLIGDDEYKTETTLPAFARAELEPLGVRCTFVIADPRTPHDFKGAEALDDADLLVVSTRRRAPKAAQMSLIRKYVESGKPLVGIRTASHAFDARGKAPAGHTEWPTFDPDVLGGHYTGHHGNDLLPEVTLAKGAEGHPILAGVSTPLRGHGSLYKTSPLAASARALLLGKITTGQGSGPPAEPVAWVNLIGSSRVFYTSLGHPGDFDDGSFRRLLRNAIFWALNREPASGSISTSSRRSPKAASSPGGEGDPRPFESRPQGPLAPRQALAAFQVPGDLRIDLVLAEPIVRQPVSISFDERGRLWVVQYLQYPAPAGLRMVSRDGVWRAVYDKVPPPPPHHFRGRDKITIHEDTDGDGAFDRHKTFVDGLNIATSALRGRGGVWVLNPPYLLFYPDRNNDDVPDGDPEVHLQGFGLEDTHSVVNSLRWGPDGWIYAAQGSTVTGHVTRPGLDDGKEPVHTMGQLIWRYHPETRRYEVFAEGGGNAFGVEIDAKGRIFSGHNGGDTRGFAYVQGGYFQKGFDKHGPLSNPYAFGYFPAMKHNRVPRFTHTFLIYEAAALPERYHGVLFGVAPLLNHVVTSVVVRDGSSVRTHDIGHAVNTTDRWFRPVDITLGPDGAIYVADWYDRQVAHLHNYEGQIDPGSGRIYRLSAKGSPAPAPPIDLGKMSTRQLVERLSDANRWIRQTSLRLIADRQDRSIVPDVSRLVWEKAGQTALEGLWALNLLGDLDESTASRALDHPDPFVRLWAARLLCDAGTVSSALASKLAHRATVETDVEVRSQLACSAKRLPTEAALRIVRQLLIHAEDAHDIHIPLLLWWAIESKAASDPEAVLQLFREWAFWGLPIVAGTLTERVMRRFAASGTRQDLDRCAQLLALAPGPEEIKRLMTGFEAAYAGRSLAGLPRSLAEALARYSGQSVALGLRQGRREAITEALGLLGNDQGDRARQLQYAQIMGEVRVPGAVPVLLRLGCQSPDNALRAAALAALANYDDPTIARDVLKTYGNLSDDLLAAAQGLLVARRAWAKQFLQAMDEGTVDPRTVPREIVERLMLLADSQIKEKTVRHFGDIKPASSAELQALISKFAGSVRSGPGVPKPGRQLFLDHCARCHTLYGKGGKVGPDLTTYRRDDLESMLRNIVNPSAEIREGYTSYVIATTDGRTLTGVLVDQDRNVFVLRPGDGKEITLPRESIEEMKPSTASLMPEGLLKDLSEQQVRDLFAYLRSTQPLID